MTNKVELNLVIKNLKEMYTREAELKETISNLEAVAKDYLIENNLETITLSNGSVSYKATYSKCLDMKNFRQAYENIYQMFAVERITKRFKVA